ncbi:PhoX family protein [bacterium]|nr:PhoX family protein [bacterium]
MTNTNRRDFFRHSAAAVGSFAVAGSLGTFLSRSAAKGERSSSKGFGALRPVKDEVTGLELVQLPEGFKYKSFSWTGDALADGGKAPGDHDGMGVIADENGVLTLCRNHEVSDPGKPFGGTSRIWYDQEAAAGCVNLRFDSKKGEWLDSATGMSGTSRNCAGGVTPWGTWLTCEETVVGIKEKYDDKEMNFDKTHGWIFEVAADGKSASAPLKDMGRFVHEAVAIDPETGIVYETEDRDECGMYRFIPSKPGTLSAGGKLQMLKVDGHMNLMKGSKVGQTYDIGWVDIADPGRAHSPGTLDTQGVFAQGKQLQGTTFARLEGCWYGNDVIYFVSTDGGMTQNGQVWQLDPKTQQIKLLFESPGKNILDAPDNIAVSPRGGICLCEDGDWEPQRVHGMTMDGELFPLIANHAQLKGEHNGITGDFRKEEMCGVTFSPDGEWLFVNMQKPGVTLAITGPWKDGGL